MGKLRNFTLYDPIESLVFFLVIAISVSLLATPYYLFAIAPPLIILFLLLLNRNPNVGYYLVIFLIPYSAYRELSNLHESLTISKFIGFWIFIVVLFYFILKRKSALIAQSNLWFWFIIFFVVSLVSSLISDFFPISLYNLNRLVISYAFFFLSLAIITRKDFCSTLPILIITSVSISSFLAIIGYLFKIPYFAMDIDSGTRAIGATFDPNGFASTITYILPLLIYMFFSTRDKYKRVLFGMLVVLNVSAIISTHSRGGFLVLSVISIFIFIENIKKLKPKYLGFAGVLLVVFFMISFFFIPESYKQRLRSMNDPTDTAIGERTSHISFGLEKFKENPLLGSGFGCYKECYATSNYARLFFGRTGDRSAFKRYAHNSYIEILVGTGILGFIPFSIIIILTFKNFNKAKKQFRQIGNANMASLVGAYRLSFISFLIYFFMLSTEFHKYFWISLAISYIALKLSQEVSVESKMKKC
jgi:putative inorganic carbon (HCO3(-)) transporter